MNKKNKRSYKPKRGVPGFEVNSLAFGLSIFKSAKLIFMIIICTGLLAGCASYNAQTVVSTSIEYAQQEIPEEQLLDVGIEVFTSETFTTEKAKKEGTLPGIRKSEGHYIPYHLKNTLQQSSHWGMVRVIPGDSDSADVIVKGKIIESNDAKFTLCKIG